MSSSKINEAKAKDPKILLEFFFRALLIAIFPISLFTMCSIDIPRECTYNLNWRIIALAVCYGILVSATFQLLKSYFFNDLINSKHKNKYQTGLYICLCIINLFLFVWAGSLEYLDGEYYSITAKNSITSGACVTSLLIAWAFVGLDFEFTKTE